MSKKAIVKVVKYPIRKGDLALLPKEQQALIALTGYAASELNVLQRLYIQAAHDLVGEECVDTSIILQRHTLLRPWSAKLFEFSECVHEIQRISSDELTSQLAARSVEKFQSLKRREGYKLARTVRHEAANHYSFKAALKNLRFVAEEPNFSMFMHEMDGNSFYPMGEEVMFIARLNRFGANLTSKEEKGKLLDTWMSWNLDANDWVRETHVEVFKNIVEKQFPNRIAREKLHWVDPHFVQDLTLATTPIFLRKSRQ